MFFFREGWQILIFYPNSVGRRVLIAGYYWQTVRRFCLCKRPIQQFGNKDNFKTHSFKNETNNAILNAY